MNKLVNGIDKRIALRRAKVRCNSAAEAINNIGASCATLAESMKKLSRFCQPVRSVKDDI